MNPINATVAGDDDDEGARSGRGAGGGGRALHGVYHVTAGVRVAVETLESLRSAGDVVVITHELTPNRRQLLRERRIAAIIDQKPILEARLAAETIARLLGRLPGEAGSIDTDIQVLLSESL